MDYNQDSGDISNVTSIGPTTNNVTFTGTGTITAPVGTTAQRPGSPIAGAYRYNSNINDLELWNGTTWKPVSGSNSVISFTISGWTLQSGNTYYADVVHNMNTKILSVTLWNNANDQLVQADKVEAISTSTVRITVRSNAYTVRCVIVTAGVFTGYSGGSNSILRTLTYYATSLDSPNNSDWPVTALAPAVASPSFPAMSVRQFNQSTEQGVGFSMTVPTGATTITFKMKSRVPNAPPGGRMVQPKIYIREIPHNAAVGAWSSAYYLTPISIPTNTYVQYSTESYPLSGVILTPGNLYQCEITRSTSVFSGTHLADSWQLIELTIEFT